MRLVDLSHPWNMHTPGWVGYPGSKIYYTQTLQTNRIVSQRVETSLHVGTHLDGPMHAADGAGDMASLPLTKLVHEGVIVDISDVVATAGPHPVLLPASRRHPRARPVDARHGDLVVGYRRRLRRSSDEHDHPVHAARPRPALRGDDGPVRA